MSSKKRNHQTIQKEANKARLEKMLFKGITNYHELAMAFGVGTGTITHWMNELREEWKERDTGDIEEKRRFRIGELQYIGYLALNAWEQSRLGKVKEECPTCKGDGEVEDLPNDWKPCPECLGEKQIEVNRMIHPGDSRYLSLAKECGVECAKIEGVHPTAVSGKKVITEAKKVGGEIERTVEEEIYIEAHPDKLLEAKRVLDELRQSSKEQAESNEGQSEVIEAESKRIEGKGEGDE